MTDTMDAIKAGDLHDTGSAATRGLTRTCLQAARSTIGCQAPCRWPVKFTVAEHQHRL